MSSDSEAGHAQSRQSESTVESLLAFTVDKRQRNAEKRFKILIIQSVIYLK